jgi:flagellar motor switch/type III secretory pathway protein FliN
VRVLAGDTSIWVRLQEWDRLFQGVDLYQGIALNQLPVDIAPAVLEAAAEPLLDKLQQTTGLPWSVLEVRAQEAGPLEWVLGLRLTSHTGEELKGAVATDSAGRELVASLLETLPLEPGDVASLPPLVAPLEIGMTSLPHQELFTLRVHDVLMIDVTAYEPNRTGVIRLSPTAAWRVTAGDDKVTLVERRTTTPRPNSPADSPTANVVFEYGRVTIPGESLEGLEPGRELAREHHDKVGLSVSGRLFAAGELVLLGNRLGVRISALGPVRD